MSTRKRFTIFQRWRKRLLDRTRNPPPRRREAMTRYAAYAEQTRSLGLGRYLAMRGLPCLVLTLCALWGALHLTGQEEAILHKPATLASFCLFTIAIATLGTVAAWRMVSSLGKPTCPAARRTAP